MYEAVHVAPDGDSDLETTVATAERFGFDGVVLRNHGGSPPQGDLDQVRAQADIDVVEGVEIVAEDRSQAGGYLTTHRPERTIVLLHGGDPDLNRFAVESERIDVLAHPLARGGDVNHVLAEKAAENDVALEVDLAPVLRSRAGRRVRAIEGLSKLWKLIGHAGAPFVLSTDARTRRQLRAPRELAAIVESIGLDAEAIEEGLRTWGKIASRNRDRLSDARIGPGVRRPAESEKTGEDRGP